MATKEGGIIDSYAHLPLGKYLDILDILRRDMDEIDTQVAVIAILADMTEDDVLHLPLGQYQALARKADFLEDPCEPYKRMAKTYRLGDMELVPTDDIHKITTAQFIDYINLAEGGSARLAEILSVILVPVGCRYADGYDIADVQDAIRAHLCVKDVYTIGAFFLNEYASYLRSSLISCERELRKMPESQKKADLKGKMEEARRLIRQLADLSRSGAGSPTSTL